MQLKKRKKKVKRMRKIYMERKTTMRRGNTYGGTRRRTGIGTTRRTKRLMKEGTQFILIYLTLIKKDGVWFKLN